MPSRNKRAHKTHAFGQRAGEPYPHGHADEGAAGSPHANDEASRLFAELCERIPDAEARASLTGVSVELDAAWRRGERLPILRAHRKRIARALSAAPPG